VEVGVERVCDAKKRVDSGWTPAALEARDRRLGGADERGEIGLGEPALLPPIRDLPGDLREQPAFLGAGEPGTNSLHGLTHISIMLYIAVVRYVFSIAVYIAVVAVFMAWAAVSDADGEVIPGLMLFLLVAIHPVTGFVIGRAWALSLVLLLPLLGLPVPVPEDAYEPFPMWFVMLYVGIPIGLLLIGIGIVGRKLWGRRHRAEVA